ncbi:hypothetical protein PR048_018616 [Dryococelus australis]|uniref:Transposase n=1 Tax=Dryococelus australis TaxID=614101 RepID=A0ABQ9HDI1_9NEOP|nr:hypothetical protein PR048_018616 [Dryococelus australis]
MCGRRGSIDMGGNRKQVGCQDSTKAERLTTKSLMFGAHSILRRMVVYLGKNTRNPAMRISFLGPLSANTIYGCDIMLCLFRNKVQGPTDSTEIYDDVSRKLIRLKELHATVRVVVHGSASRELLVMRGGEDELSGNIYQRAWCITDVNEDSLRYLVLGSPLSTEQDSLDGAGAVYIIYINKKEVYPDNQQDDMGARWHGSKMTWGQDDMGAERRRKYRQKIMQNFSLHTIKIFWDATAYQFKNKYTVSNISYINEEFSVIDQWYLFASSHGKGAVDGLGAGVKSRVWCNRPVVFVRHFPWQRSCRWARSCGEEQSVWYLFASSHGKGAVDGLGAAVMSSVWCNRPVVFVCHFPWQRSCRWARSCGVEQSVRYLFATSHGKGAVDGLGAAVKCRVWCMEQSGIAMISSTKCRSFNTAASSHRLQSLQFLQVHDKEQLIIGYTFQSEHIKHRVFKLEVSEVFTVSETGCTGGNMQFHVVQTKPPSVSEIRVRIVALKEPGWSFRRITQRIGRAAIADNISTAAKTRATIASRMSARTITNSLLNAGLRARVPLGRLPLIPHHRAARLR